MAFLDIFKAKPTKKELELEAKLLEMQRQISLQASLKADGIESQEEKVADKIMPKGDYYYKNVFKTEIGWHYEILQGENVIIQQDYMPDVGGLQIMTEDEAIFYADRVLKSLKGGDMANGNN